MLVTQTHVIRHSAIKTSKNVVNKCMILTLSFVAQGEGYSFYLSGNLLTKVGDF